MSSWSLPRYDELTTFVRAVKAAGVDHVVVHARKCLLKGLSTSANRTIPPLRYDVVHRLAQEFPELEIVLNGGIDSLGAVNEHIAGTGEWGGYGGGVAGVMVGRAAYFDPWTFRHTDSAVFGSSDPGARGVFLSLLGTESTDRTSDNFGAGYDPPAPSFSGAHLGGLLDPARGPTLPAL